MHIYVIIEKLTWYQLMVHFMLFLGCTTWLYTHVCTLQNMFGICFWKSFLLLIPSLLSLLRKYIIWLLTLEAVYIGVGVS